MIPYSDPSQPKHLTPYVNVGLIAVNFLVFFYELYEQSLGQLNHLFLAYTVVPCELFQRCPDYPGAPHPIYVTILTGMFMHAGWLHILGNMLFLWVFGDNIENAMGHFRYLVFYLLCGIAAALAQSAADMSSHVPALGASGAIAGVLAAYLLLFPTATISVLVFFFIIPLPIRVYAWILIGLWFAEQLLNGLAALGPHAQVGGVAYMAHVGGFICGALLVWFFRRRERVHATKHYHELLHGRSELPPAWPWS
jgi:membrane associated rhomboid family serine protease